MFAVNGLFGWTRANDRRSMLLFGGFVVALQLAAAVVLYLPLAGLDEAHAPFLHWGGYALRYTPLVALAAAGVFALSMFWHVHSVRRVIPFTFVDNDDEPRLCDIVEPLAIGMGLPAPYLAVIESPALNAFACGIRQGDAVVVVTRGLLNALDDEELAAVIAHELAHIANGDIRLMAAANVCLGMLRRMVMSKAKRAHPLMEMVGLPLVLFMAPPVFVAVLMLAFLSQCALRAGHLVRSLIGASREFVADAAAVEATQNPAALVSALQRIEGRSRIAGMLPMQEAMMIDGAAAGPFATHPSIAARVKAMIAMTGSMALIAPTRRDTRQAAAPTGSFGRRAAAHAVAGGVIEAQPERADPTEGRNWLGLTPVATIGAVLGVVLFVGWRGAELRDAGRVLAEFGPRPASALFVAVGRNTVCGLSAAVHAPACAPGEMARVTKRFAHEPGRIGQLFTAMEHEGETFRSAGVTDSAPADEIAAEVKAKRCFVTDSYTVGQFGLHPVVPGGQTEEYSIDRWLASGDDSARAVIAAAARPDAALAAYLTVRKERVRIVHPYFGEPGLAYALQRFGGGEHAAAVAILRQRLADPAFVKALGPAARAEMRLLAEAPDAFIPCRAPRAS
ncbi:MAG: M48 family metalloprotease [Caulobacteraceae bacterium]